MECPQDCPHFIYSIMLDAWAAEPSQRPTFAEILDRLQHPPTSNDEETTPNDFAAFQGNNLDTSGSSAYDSIFDDKIV